MFKRERQAFILYQVNPPNKVLSTSLSEEMKASEDTVRRDLQVLAEELRIIKVHEGAFSPLFNYAVGTVTKVYAHDLEKTVAQKAVSLIKDGMFVLTTGGITILEIARMLPPQLKAAFIPGSVPAVLEYAQHPNFEVIIIGDKVSKKAKTTVIESSRKTIRLMVSKKLNSFQPVQIGELNKIDILITGLPPEDTAINTYRSAGVSV